MKAYTDISQSKKLAEILPLESADMCFNISQRYNMPPLMTPYSKFNEFFNMEKTPDFLIPCWSLVALLNILDFPALTQEDENEWEVCVQDYNNDEYIEITADNPVDACVETIVKLHEQKLL